MGLLFSSVRKFKGEKAKMFFVHRLVCWTFHGPPPTSNHQVNHINENPLDNRASNLEWVTRDENNEKYWGHRRKSKPKWIRPGTFDYVKDDTLLLLLRDRVSTYRIGELLGVTNQAVSQRIRRILGHSIQENRRQSKIQSPCPPG